MRTVINLDEEACLRVMEAYGFKTKTDAVNFAMRDLMRRRTLEIAFLDAKGIDIIVDIDAHYREHGPVVEDDKPKKARGAKAR